MGQVGWAHQMEEDLSTHNLVIAVRSNVWLHQTRVSKSAISVGLQKGALGSTMFSDSIEDADWTIMVGLKNLACQETLSLRLER